MKLKKVFVSIAITSLSFIGITVKPILAHPLQTNMPDFISQEEEELQQDLQAQPVVRGHNLDHYRDDHQDDFNGGSLQEITDLHDYAEIWAQLQEAEQRGNPNTTTVELNNNQTASQSRTISIETETMCWYVANETGSQASISVKVFKNDALIATSIVSPNKLISSFNVRPSNPGLYRITIERIGNGACTAKAAITPARVHWT